MSEKLFPDSAFAYISRCTTAALALLSSMMLPVCGEEADPKVIDGRRGR
jgi:hypothetical protein